MDWLRRKRQTWRDRLPAQDPDRAIATRIFLYLDDRRTFDRSTINRNLDGDKETARWAASRRRHLIAELLSEPQAITMGDPPTADTAKTTIGQIIAKGNTAIATTVEDYSPLPDLPAHEFEYKLRVVLDEWRISDRRELIRDDDGRVRRYRDL